MKYLRKLWAKRPLGRKRRKAAAEAKRLWQPVPLEKKESQSEGELYEYFLSSSERDIHKWHHYFDIYERHLKRFVGTPFRFLEIGVFRGGSQRMWRDYFGADATIVGIDIDVSCAELDGRHGAVRIGDQSDPAFLSSVCEEFGSFDAILDDGGHDPSQQIASFCHLYPLLAENGVYICEDTQTNYWPTRQDLGRHKTFVNLAAEVAKRLTEPHYSRANYDRFGRRPTEREGELNVSYLAATTFSVQFYDAVVVLEKRRKAEPWHAIR
jgi:hypothetical protein